MTPNKGLQRTFDLSPSFPRKIFVTSNAARFTRLANANKGRVDMLSVKIDDVNGIAFFEPNGPLSASDFRSAVKIVDPWIEKYGNLKGLIIYTKSFPGWDSFGALSSHLVFVKDHHKMIGRVAFVTDSVVGNVAEKIASHFVKADIELFPYKALEEARSWVSGVG